MQAGKVTGEQRPLGVGRLPHVLETAAHPMHVAPAAWTCVATAPKKLRVADGVDCGRGMQQQLLGVCQQPPPALTTALGEKGNNSPANAQIEGLSTAAPS